MAERYERRRARKSKLTRATLVGVRPRTRPRACAARGSWLAVIALGWVAWGCRGASLEGAAPSATREPLRRDPSTPSGSADAVPFGPELREAELAFARDLLRESYAHLELKRGQWGVDLDAEYERHLEPLRRADTWRDYERVMVSFVSSFHDGHLRWKRKRGADETPRRHIRLGFETRYVQGGLFVSTVWPHSHAARTGLRVGDEIVAVDGATVLELFADYQAQRSWSRVERAVYLFERHWSTTRLYENEEPEPRRITHRRDGDAYRTLLIPPENSIYTQGRPGAVSLREVHGQYLLEVSTLLLRRDDVRQRMSAVRDTIYRRPLPLVIDLRGNPGGYDNAARAVAGSLTSRPVPGALRRMRLSERVLTARPEWRDLPRDPARPDWSTPQPLRAQPLASADYPAPLVVLVDAGCNSSCESLALLLRALGARLFGEPTAGSSGGPIHIELPHSGALLSVPVWSLEDLRGQALEGRGVIPDERLEITRHDLLPGADRVLAHAQLWLRARHDLGQRVAGEERTERRRTTPAEPVLSTAQPPPPPGGAPPAARRGVP